MSDAQIAELIKRRRHQLLVHSYIYYDLDQNLISDSTWSEWAVELENLQRDYPEISKQVELYSEFYGFEHSTGSNLPYRLPWVIRVAERLLKG